MNRVWVHEGDLQTEETLVRLFIDQLRAARRQVIQRGGEIGHRVGDVVHSLPALGEEPAHRRVVAEGRHELHAALTEANGGRLHALGGNQVAVLHGATKEPFVSGDGAVKILDRNAHMVHTKD